MTNLKDHAQKIERIVQALTAEGIGRDVAVSTALMRFPPTRTLGVNAELAALSTKDGVRPALDPIPELAECEPLDIELSQVVDVGQRARYLHFTATKRAGSPTRFIFAGEFSHMQIEEATAMLRSMHPVKMKLDGQSRTGVVYGFTIDRRRGDRICTLEFHAETGSPAVATVSVTPEGRAVPVASGALRLVSLKRARALWELLRDIEALDISDYEDPADYMKAVDHRAQKRDQYLSGGHLIVVSDQTREMTAEENAGVVGDAIRDVCMDAAARTSERDAAIDQRDTLIDREAQMRAACIDAIGPVSSGSTLDLVRDLAKTYAALRVKVGGIEDAHIKAVGVLEAAAGLARGSSHRSIVDLAQKVQGLLNEARGSWESSKQAHRTEVNRADERWTVIITLRDILGGGSTDEIIATAREHIRTLASVRTRLQAALPTTDTGRPTLELLDDLVESSQAIEQRANAVRSALIEATGNRANTLDTSMEMAVELARLLKVAQAEIADYARLREHNVQLQALVSKVRAAMS